MRFNRKQGQFLREVIARWETDGTIGADTANALKNSFAVRPFDWARLARYAFIIALACAVVAVGSVVADKRLADLIERVFSAPDGALCLFFAGMAAMVFYYGLRLRRASPENAFANEAVLFVAVLLLAAAVAFLGRMLDRGSGQVAPLLLLAALLYGAIGCWFASKLVWFFSLLSLGSWFGAETGYVSGWGVYYLGMTYPLRFVLFGAALTGLSFCCSLRAGTTLFRGVTFTMGLLYLFVALWILSIFGNGGDGGYWSRGGAADRLLWSAALGVAALAAIGYGLKRDDGTARGFGLTFFFLNLYTKYFEYFWDGMHKAAFFVILAVSFWLLGRKAEALWKLEFAGNRARRAAGTDDAAG